MNNESHDVIEANQFRLTTRSHVLTLVLNVQACSDKRSMTTVLWLDTLETEVYFTQDVQANQELLG